jgi:hypothetical protein
LLSDKNKEYMGNEEKNRYEGWLNKMLN